MVEMLPAHHLARWLAGGPEENREAAASCWPDLPSTRDEAKAWLAQRQEIAKAVGGLDPMRALPGGPPLTGCLLTADQLLTTAWPEPAWAIPGLLPAGLTFMAGKPKTGKSWLALQLAQSVATGGRAFDQPIERGPTLYLALEDPPRRLAQRMKLQSWPLGTDAEFMTIGDFADHLGDLRKEGGQQLAAQMATRHYRYVVIDTLSRSVRGDQCDADEMTVALSPIQEAAHECNCAVVIVDHHRKGFGANPDAITDILGSTAKSALADCVWGLYREPGQVGAKLQVIGRDVEEQTLALKFDTMTGCWQCEGNAYELAMTERREEILDALATLRKSSLNDIASYVEQAKSNTHNRLQDLVAAGKVLRIEEGNRVYYDLP